MRNLPRNSKSYCYNIANLKVKPLTSSELKGSSPSEVRSYYRWRPSTKTNSIVLKGIADNPLIKCYRDVKFKIIFAPIKDRDESN